MGVRLAPVPYEYWGDDRSNAMEWNSLASALRALRALKLDAFGARVEFARIRASGASGT